MGGSAGAGGSSGVLCGPQSGTTPVIYTTLDDAASVLSPAVGDGTGASLIPNDGFVAGLCGQALRIDDTGELVSYAQVVGNSPQFDYDLGAIDFWYQPGFDHTDGLNHHLFGTEDFSTGGIRIRKAAANNGNNFQVIFFNGAGGLFETQVAPSDYRLSPGQWVRITVSWNTQRSGNAVRIFFDAQEATYATTAKGPFSMPPASSNDSMFLGAWHGGDPEVADGLLDDFKLYTSELTP